MKNKYNQPPYLLSGDFKKNLPCLCLLTSNLHPLYKSSSFIERLFVIMEAKYGRLTKNEGGLSENITCFYFVMIKFKVHR